MLFQIILQIFERIDRSPAESNTSVLCRISVEHRFDLKSSFLKSEIAGDRLSEFACADDDQAVGLIKSQNLPDLFIEMRNIVPISLLSEPSEQIQILADL